MLRETGTDCTRKDFGGQTSKKLLQNTPTKNKQKKIIHSQGRKIKQLQTALGKTRPSKKITREIALKEALAKLPENLASFVKMQLKLYDKKKRKEEDTPPT